MMTDWLVMDEAESRDAIASKKIDQSYLIPDKILFTNKTCFWDFLKC